MNPTALMVMAAIIGGPAMVAPRAELAKKGLHQGACKLKKSSWRVGEEIRAKRKAKARTKGKAQRKARRA